MSLFGFLCCNKPPGMTSRDVVNIVQRRVRHELNRRDVKVGHAGTLDPLAAGVLVIGVGPASRLVPYVQQQPKHYRATFRFGESTVSGDLEGEITRYPDLPEPNREQINQAAASLLGTIQQTPPAHSAIWVDGKRAYKRIRAGESFEMPSRTVEVHSLDVLRYDFPELDLDIVCGSGTYIRSIGIDLAVAAGSAAVMSHLIRLGVGPFVIADAMTIDQLREEDLESKLLPPTMSIGHLHRLVVNEVDSERLGHGKNIEAEANGAEAAAITADGQLRAIVRWKEDAWYPYRVFPV
jgi:tRNA pseudouridine55 synthase